MSPGTFFLFFFCVFVTTCVCLCVFQVMYNVNGILAANKDTLFASLINAMLTSTDRFICALFEKDEKALLTNTKKRPVTTATQFKTAVQALIQTLLSARPHYCRCVCVRVCDCCVFCFVEHVSLFYIL